MAVKIRLSRTGKKHVPFYRIVAVDARQKRDGECIEILGTYDGLKNKIVQIHEERINDWVSKGAEVSDSVKKIQRLHKVATSQVKKAVAPKKSNTAESKAAAQ